MEEKTFETYVKGVYCRQCPEWILTELLQTRGVLSADLTWRKAFLTVRYDPAIVTEAALRDALDRIGYPACEKGAPGSNPMLNALLGAVKGKTK